MKLPILFKKKEKPKQQANLFLGILLTDQTVHSAVWTVAHNDIVISHRSQVHYFSKDKDRLEVIDKSLQDLGPDSEKTDDVVFGFEPSWVNRSGIIDTKKSQLKTITNELSLEAVGYVVVTEALRQHLAAQNKMLSGVILYVTRRSIHLNLIKQGKEVAKQSAGRSQDIVADLKEVVARLQQSHPDLGKLPPNVILASGLIDSDKLGEYQQQLIDQNWADELGFLQEPVIRVLGQEKMLDIVVLEGGRAVAQARGLFDSESQSTETQTPQKLELGEAESSQTQTSFGVPIRPEAVPEPDRINDTPNNLDRDSAQGSSKAVSRQLRSEETAVADHLQATSPKKGISNLKKKKPAVTEDKARDFRPKKKGFPLKTAIIIGIIAGLTSLSGLAYWILQNNYRAKVMVSPKVEMISKDETVILVENKQATQSAQLVIEAEEAYQTVSDQDSKPTTGVKLIGEKAEGKIIIFNKTDEEKSFGEETTFYSDSLEFKLKEEVTVPAAEVEENEEGDGEIKEYGQIEAELVAVEIGADSNVEKDAEFQIDKFSQDTYSAKADDDFAGGSSREIRVVSEEDKETLLTSLTQDLKEQARQTLEDKNDDGYYVIATDDYEIVNQEFDAEVGDEVETISLDLELRLKGLSYTQDDFRPLVTQALSADLPEGYQLKEQDPDILSQPAEETEEGVYSFAVNLTAPATTDIDKEQLLESLLAKPISEAQAILNENASIDQSEIKLQPNFAEYFFQTLPKTSDRIDLQVQSD